MKGVQALSLTDPVIGILLSRLLTATKIRRGLERDIFRRTVSESPLLAQRILKEKPPRSLEQHVPRNSCKLLIHRCECVLRSSPKW